MQIDIQPNEVRTIAEALRYQAGDMASSVLFRRDRDKRVSLLMLANQMEERAQLAARTDQIEEDG